MAILAITATNEARPLQAQPLDCSWCAAEQNQPTTESPTICPHHEAIVLQQVQERRTERQARR
jgi:hypothetical protein